MQRGLELLMKLGGDADAARRAPRATGAGFESDVLTVGHWLTPHSLPEPAEPRSGSILLTILCGSLSHQPVCPFVKRNRQLDIVTGRNRGAGIDGFCNLPITVGNPHINGPMQCGFEFLVCQYAVPGLPVQYDVDGLFWIMQADEVFDGTYRIADCRQLGSYDDGNLVRLSHRSAGLFGHPWRTVDQHELVVLSKERQRMFDGLGRRMGEVVDHLRRIQHMQPAFMLQQEPLQKFEVEPVGVVDELVEAVLMALDAKV